MRPKQLEKESLLVIYTLLETHTKKIGMLNEKVLCYVVG